MDNKKTTQENYLAKFLSDDESKNENLPKKTNNTHEFNHENHYDTHPNNNSLDYLSIDINELPLGIFYQIGTQIKIRAAKVHEVQNYSVVDDKNFLDVTEKMNQLLSSCIKFTLPNGNQGSYKDVKDGDRLYLVFMIRELTFQKGNSLAKEVDCPHCSNVFSIPFRATANTEYPKTFENHIMPKSIEKYYNEKIKCFEFEIADNMYRLAPPTIGIQELFYSDIKTKVQNQKNPNVSFLKIIPYLLWDRNTITDAGIKAKEEEFKKMDMNTFQIINQAVDKMVFGLKGLKMTCSECGGEVHADMSFPNGASSLFVIPDFFDNFNKK
jgi:hypothetical protein